MTTLDSLVAGFIYEKKTFIPGSFKPDIVGHTAISCTFVILKINKES